MQDLLRIAGLTVDCVVGVYPHERDTPQPLTVDLDMRLDTEPAALSERMKDTIDYEAVSAQIGFLLRNAHFRMLETAAHAIAKHVLVPPSPGEERPAIEAVSVRLTKHGALGGIAVPSVEIERGKRWAEIGREQKSFGTVDVIHETRDAGMYRLNIAPGASIPLHVHRQMHESEMVLTEGLHVQRRLVPQGTVHRWPRGAPHCYDNPSDQVQSVLCIDSPPFIEEDEVEVQGEPARVEPETAWGAPLRLDP
jgi:dihydroneopterin aldolase